MMTAMADAPRFLCPRCGCSLRGLAGTVCPDCGFVVDATRVQHRGAMRYWRFLRNRRRLDYLVVLLWLAAAGLGCWVLSLRPTTGFVVLIVGTAVAMIALSKYLLLRRTKKKN